MPILSNPEYDLFAFFFCLYLFYQLFMMTDGEGNGPVNLINHVYPNVAEQDKSKRKTKHGVGKNGDDEDYSNKELFQLIKNLINPAEPTPSQEQTAVQETDSSETIPRTVQDQPETNQQDQREAQNLDDPQSSRRQSRQGQMLPDNKQSRPSLQPQAPPAIQPQALPAPQPQPASESQILPAPPTTPQPSVQFPPEDSTNQQGNG